MLLLVFYEVPVVLFGVPHPVASARTVTVNNKNFFLIRVPPKYYKFFCQLNTDNVRSRIIIP